MIKAQSPWFNRVGGFFVCPHCEGFSIKYGKSAAGKQRYFCKNCSKTYLDNYTKRAYSFAVKEEIKKLLKESIGIKGMSRYLGVAKNTILSGILNLARSVRKPPVVFGMTYEVDEQHTYIQNREFGETLITYAFCRETSQVVDFVIGGRSNLEMKRLTNPLLLPNPIKIYTDGLANYKSLIPKYVHCTKKRGTNHIERQNLQNRNDLKRLGRSTLCYSKSLVLLEACLRIYFWG